MERNENYWGNVPQIKTLILKPISDASARLAALQSGEVDWAEVVPVESLESLKSQGYQVKLNDYPHAWLYIMNTESGPFADARVRQAFSMSIDREGLCNDILQGVGTPLAQLMYPGSPWYADGVEEYTYNPGEGERTAGRGRLSRRLYHDLCLPHQRLWQHVPPDYE